MWIAYSSVLLGSTVVCVFLYATCRQWLDSGSIAIEGGGKVRVIYYYMVINVVYSMSDEYVVLCTV